MGEIIPLNFFYATLMTILHWIMMEKMEPIKERKVKNQLTAGKNVKFLFWGVKKSNFLHIKTLPKANVNMKSRKFTEMRSEKINRFSIDNLEQTEQQQAKLNSTICLFKQCFSLLFVLNNAKGTNHNIFIVTYCLPFHFMLVFILKFKFFLFSLLSCVWKKL